MNELATYKFCPKMLNIAFKWKNSHSLQIGTAAPPFPPAKGPFPLLRRLLLWRLRLPPLHPKIVPSPLHPAKNQVRVYLWRWLWADADVGGYSSKYSYSYYLSNAPICQRFLLRVRFPQNLHRNILTNILQKYPPTQICQRFLLRVSRLADQLSFRSPTSSYLRFWHKSLDF